jgi:hypothetical protein
MPIHSPPDDPDPDPHFKPEFEPTQTMSRLKREFFGLDDVLTRLVQTVHAWRSYAHLRSSPVVVNIWGMTGTGKSTLIRRVLQETGLEQRSVWIDLTHRPPADAVRRDLRDGLERSLPEPTVLVVDGIQEARSMDGEGLELESQAFGEIWSRFETARSESAPGEAGIRAPLVFTMGSLDASCPPEMSMNREISADQFAELVKGLTPRNLLQGLSHVFSANQLARLGHRHLILPPPGDAEYRLIAAREIDRFRAALANLHGSRIDCDATLVDRILKQSLIPSMGARPVLERISDLFLEQFAPVLTKMEPGRWLLRADAEGCLADMRPIGASPFDPPVKTVRLNRAGSPRPSASASLESRAVVSVHEAGHAVASWILEGKLPERVRSTSESPGSQGSVVVPDSTEPVSLETAIRRIGTLFGGLVAEQTVFGPEHVTRGSLQDVQAATDLARKFALDLKFASMLGLHRSMGEGTEEKWMAGHDSESRMEEACESLLKQSVARVRQVMADHETLLEEVARELVERSELTGRDIVQIAERELGERPRPKGVSYHGMLFARRSSAELSMMGMVDELRLAVDG